MYSKGGYKLKLLYSENASRNQLNFETVKYLPLYFLSFGVSVQTRFYIRLLISEPFLVALKDSSSLLAFSLLNH